MRQQPDLTRIGGLSAMLGVTLAVLGAMLGPLDLDYHDMEAVLRAFAESPGRMHLHGLSVSVGTLLVLGGLVGLAQSLREGKAGAWARLGLAAAVVMTGVHLLGAVLGGSVLPALAASHAGAPAGEATTTLSVGRGFYLFYESLLAPTFLTLAATVLLFSTAMLRSSLYSSWLAWVGALAGAWTATAAVAFALVGPVGASELMLPFIPGFMLSMIWIFAAGLLLLRQPAGEHLRPAVSATAAHR